MKNDVKTPEHRVFITRSILPSGVNFLKESGLEVVMRTENSPISRAELEKEAKNSHALISMLSDPIDEEFLEKNRHLKVISNFAVGLNNIDVKAASRLKILIGHTPDVLTEATAEIAFGLMIACARNFKLGMKDAEKGRWGTWQPMGYLGQELKGKTIGIIGFGRIGKEMARMCEATYKMKILGLHSQSSQEDLHHLLTHSDVVSVHTPATPKTVGMIGKSELSRMKPTAILVNTSRGEIIDQEALYEALQDKKIFAAGLDVTTPEPLPKEHPLYSLSNVIILPHIGSATMETRSAMSVLAAQNIVAGISQDFSMGSFANKADL